MQAQVYAAEGQADTHGVGTSNRHGRQTSQCPGGDIAACAKDGVPASATRSATVYVGIIYDTASTPPQKDTKKPNLKGLR